MIAISVVIPVYNAEKFLRQAVMSALEQPEVAEVLLVEDRSPDNCLAICQELAQADTRVKVFQHPGGENRGAAASRNLGIINAQSQYVAFLDADDYYLPGRFKKASELFQSNSSIEGVYDAIGLHIYSQQGKARYENYKGKTMAADKLISVRKEVAPTALFESLLSGKNGIFHANGVVVKRELLLRTGLFDEHLNIVEDTVLWLKLAFHGKLVAGDLQNPVARQGIHDENREPDTKPILLYHKYQTLLNYFRQQPVHGAVLRTLLVRMVAYSPSRTHTTGVLGKAQLFALLVREIAKQPALLLKLIR